MSRYLTFDIGTTALKTALVSDEGAVLAVHTEEYHLRTPQPGWAEMEPEAYWRAAVAGARAVLAHPPAPLPRREGGAEPHPLTPSPCRRGGAEARLAADFPPPVAGGGQGGGPNALLSRAASVGEGSQGGEVRAIGFASQGQSFIPLSSTGEALYNAIVWVDGRANEIAQRWERDWLAREKYRRISGYPWIPGEMTVFKLAWLAEHAPAAHRADKFLFLPDYLIWRLTGETATDYNIAQMSGMYDIRARGWSAPLLTAAGVSEEQLPAVHAPGTVVGTLREEAARELGLAAGVPVCVGCNDQLAGAVGAGNVEPGLVTETTGTALAAITTTAELVDDNRVYAGRHAAPGLHYTMTFAPTSAIVLKWLRDLCAPGEDYDTFLEGAAEIPPGCEGLTMLPHFCGTATPSFNAQARGAFAGLQLGHTRAHLARAVMEACACLLRECLEPLQQGGLKVTSVRSLGGAARSDLWLQMKADLLGLPVERPACADAANLGAAMLAATGVGQFARLEEAAQAWYRSERVFEPHPGRLELYQEVYRRYRGLYERLYGEVSPPTPSPSLRSGRGGSHKRANRSSSGGSMQR